MAYVEIYNETIKDLLSPSSTDLRIVEDKKRGTYLTPLKEEIVTSPEQVMRVIQAGEANRHFGATDSNFKSSRSHTILQMVTHPSSLFSLMHIFIKIIESRESLASSRGGRPSPISKVTISQLNLIDLAGT